MFKYTLYLVLIFICNTSPSLAQLDSTKHTQLLFSGGIAIPSAPKYFTDSWNNGYNFSGGIDFPVSKIISLNTSIDYNTFVFHSKGFLKSNGIFNSDFTITGGNASIFTVTSSIKTYLIENSESFYTTTGIGFFNISFDDIEVSYSSYNVKTNVASEEAIAVLIGLGLEKVLKFSTFFIEGKYIIGFTDDKSTKFIPIRIGIKKNF